MRALGLPLLVLALATAGTAAAAPRASMPDIEDEVMCVECGTALNLSHAPVAERERAFIRREIARGRTKQQIKNELVDRFGPGVLAMPEDKGFGRAAYLVPILAALLASIAVFVAVRHWRRRAPARPATVAGGLDPSDRSRLDRELAAYDRGLAGPQDSGERGRGSL
jgi:cytochrome c-type biogenesis protein CcmH